LVLGKVNVPSVVDEVFVVLENRNTILTGGLVVVLVLGFIYSKLPSPLPEQSISARLLGTTIYEPGESDHYLIDNSRATLANGSFSGLGHRELDTRIWYPMVEREAVAIGRHPLLVFSHGFSSGKDGGAYLAQFLARQGYIVVAADFPLSQVGAPGGATARDVMSQPGDVSFLLDTIMSWDDEPDSPYYERIDHDRIGTIGLSLGGLTSALLIYHPELRDRRIKFGVAVAAPLGNIDGRWLRQGDTPFMVIASGQDALIDYTGHARQVVDSMPGATLVTLRNASHAGFSGFSRYLRWLPNPDLVTCARVRSDLGQDSSLASLLVVSEGGLGARSASPSPPLCEARVSRVMNPVRQQWITALSVYNFVQQQFADSGTEIASAFRYLHEVMPVEFSGSVTVDAGYSPVASLSQRGDPARR
jgi:predicted dienelactone hydrolase